MKFNALVARDDPGCSSEKIDICKWDRQTSVPRRTRTSDAATKTWRTRKRDCIWGIHGSSSFSSCRGYSPGCSVARTAADPCCTPAPYAAATTLSGRMSGRSRCRDTYGDPIRWTCYPRWSSSSEGVCCTWQYAKMTAEWISSSWPDYMSHLWIKKKGRDEARCRCGTDSRLKFAQAMSNFG